MTAIEYRPEICADCNRGTWCEWRQNSRGQGKWQCRGCKVERFFERVLYAPMGYKMLPWLRKVLRDLYGTVDPTTGLRQYQKAYICVSKQNGKSTLVSGLPIYHLICEDNQEVYGAAAAKEQAGNVYNPAMKLVRANRLLSDQLKILESTKRILRRDRGGKYVVLSADGDVQDGIHPSLAIIDELHRWKPKRAEVLYDILNKGRISQPEPLIIQVTTCGEKDECQLWEREHEFAKGVIDGTFEAPRYYACIFSADQKRIDSEPDYWKSREARVAANPSHEDHGGFIKDQMLVDELKQAEMKPLERHKYFRYHLGLVAQSDAALIPSFEWAECGRALRALVDRPCWAGVDLSATTDLTALVFVFPDADGSYDLLPYYFMPAGRVQERERRDRVPYSDWVEKGYITATEQTIVQPNGNMLVNSSVVDYEAVRDRLKQARSMFDVQEVAYDPWNGQQFMLNLVQDGFTCIEIPQNFAHLSGPTKKLLELVMARQLRHAGNPVLTWNARCAVAKDDGKDNIMLQKPRRSTSPKRIDGLSATVTALARAIVYQDQNSGVLVH